MSSQCVYHIEANILEIFDIITTCAAPQTPSIHTKYVLNVCPMYYDVHSAHLNKDVKLGNSKGDPWIFSHSPLSLPFKTLTLDKGQDFEQRSRFSDPYPLPFSETLHNP